MTKQKLAALEAHLMTRHALEIAAVDGDLWMAQVVTRRGRRLEGLKEGVPSFVEALTRLNHDLLGAEGRRSDVRTTPDTLALKVLQRVGIIFEVTLADETYTVTIGNPSEGIGSMTLRYRESSLWRALHEAVATALATISMAHLAHTFGN